METVLVEEAWEEGDTRAYPTPGQGGQPAQWEAAELTCSSTQQRNDYSRTFHGMHLIYYCRYGIVALQSVALKDVMRHACLQSKKAVTVDPER